jgi:membrane peptidoglycan carboxypeptidase
MDEHNNNQPQDTPSEDTPVLVTERHNADGNGRMRLDDKSTRKLIPITPAMLAAKEHPATSLDLLAVRRTRLNRLLIRRRRWGRDAKDLAPRLMIVLAIALIILTAFFSSGAGVAFAYYQSQQPLLDGIAQHSLFQTTRIFDRNGKLLYELYDHQNDRGRRTYVNYPDISPLLINATVAAEDHTFWTNGGVDFYGIARATVSDFEHHALVEGASTITQQVIKNQFFNNQPRTFQVKGEEALLAAGLTNQYPKWKIMEMYLNTVYYGDLNYGAEAAAEGYFGIQPKCTHTQCTPAIAQLDLAQASLLAGLPQSPSYYDPVINKQVALDRQKDVLNQMVELSMITEQQALQAEQETAKFRFRPYSDTHPMQAPHFVQYVINQV